MRSRDRSATCVALFSSWCSGAGFLVNFRCLKSIVPARRAISTPAFDSRLLRVLCGSEAVAKIHQQTINYQLGYDVSSTVALPASEQGRSSRLSWAGGDHSGLSCFSRHPAVPACDAAAVWTPRDERRRAGPSRQVALAHRSSAHPGRGSSRGPTVRSSGPKKPPPDFASFSSPPTRWERARFSGPTTTCVRFYQFVRPAGGGAGRLPLAGGAFDGNTARPRFSNVELFELLGPPAVPTTSCAQPLSAKSSATWRRSRSTMCSDPNAARSAGI